MECKYKETCGHDYCNLDECPEFEERKSDFIDFDRKVRKSANQEIFDEYQENNEDYTLQTDEQLIQKISDFGSGELDFHTADIDRILAENRMLTMLLQKAEETAKRTRDVIISEDVEKLKAIYMAGEICMWDELEQKKLKKDGTSENAVNEIQENVIKWAMYPKNKTPYDGKYLCCIKQQQECGNILEYQKIAENRSNDWILEEKEVVVAWSHLAKSPCL